MSQWFYWSGGSRAAGWIACSAEAAAAWCVAGARVRLVTLTEAI
jgi:hypothetical protein